MMKTKKESKMLKKLLREYAEAYHKEQIFIERETPGEQDGEDYKYNTLRARTRILRIFDKIKEKNNGV